MLTMTYFANGFSPGKVKVLPQSENQWIVGGQIVLQRQGYGALLWRESGQLNV